MLTFAAKKRAYLIIIRGRKFSPRMRPLFEKRRLQRFTTLFSDFVYQIESHALTLDSFFIFFLLPKIVLK